MSYIEWNETYSVGIEAMDIHHKKLIGIYNELHEGISSGHSEEALRKTLSNLVDYTKYHFSAEEALMKKYDYPEYPAQKEAHEKLIATLGNLQQQFEEGKGGLTIVLKIQNFLRSWLINHILDADKKYGPYLNNKGLM